MKTATQITDSAHSILVHWLNRARELSLGEYTVNFMDFFEWMNPIPQGCFRRDEMEAGDWVASYDGDDESYREYAYATNFGRDEGGLYIEIEQVDRDGNWDMSERWYHDEAEKQPEAFRKAMWAYSPASDILDNANYAEWVYRTGDDCLNNWFKNPKEDELKRRAFDSSCYDLAQYILPKKYRGAFVSALKRAGYTIESQILTF